MRVTYNDWDDRAGLRGYVQFNKYTHTERGRGRGRGRGPVVEHRMGTGTEARTVAEMETGTAITGTRIGSGRAEARRKSARNRKIAVDAVRETGETWWVESEKHVEKIGLVQKLPTRIT